MSITAKIQGLNHADLSRLNARLLALKKQAEFSTKSATENTIAGSSGLTAEQLLNELAQAKRSAA